MVRVIKIGSIVGEYILVVDPNAIKGIDSDTISDYINFLKENNPTDYKVMATSGILTRLWDINGKLRHKPEVGFPFMLGSFHTTEITYIIGDLFLTKNSLYLIYSKSIDRDKKLTKLGIE